MLTGETDANVINIIGKKTFLNNLAVISKKMGEEERLPLEIINDNLYNFLMISNTTVKFVETTVILSISIPTVGNVAYQHYQIFAIPTREKEKMWLASELAGNILLDKQNNEYMLLSNMELNSCNLMNATAKICSSTAPIYRKPSCEFEALIFKNTSNCKFEEIPKRGYIKHISGGEFIIIPFVSVEIFIVCGNGTSVARRITQESTIIIDDGCSLENDDLRYVVNGEVVENIAISEEPIDHFYSQIGDVLKTVANNYNGTNFFDDSDRMFDNISLELAKLHEFASIQPKHIVVSEDEFGGLALFIIAIVVLICIRCGCSLITRYLP